MSSENLFLSYHGEPDTYGLVIDKGESRHSIPMVSPRVSRLAGKPAVRQPGLATGPGSVQVAGVSFDGTRIETTSCDMAPPGALVVFSGMTAVRLAEGFLSLDGARRQARPKDYQFHVLTWKLIVRQESADFEFDVSV